MWLTVLIFIAIVVGVAYIVVNEKEDEYTQWLAGGSNDEDDIKWSKDGKNWITSTGVNQGIINTVVYGGGNTAVAGSSNGKLFHSKDGGKSWEEATQIGSTQFANVKGIALGKDGSGADRYVAVGERAGAAELIAYSSDGKTWQTDDTGFGSYNRFNCVIYSREKEIWVIGADSFSSDSKPLLYSTDGENWTKVTSEPVAVDSAVLSIAYGNNRFIATSDEPDPLAYISSNGKDWSRLGSGIYDNGMGTLRSVGYGKDENGDGLWVVVGEPADPVNLDSNLQWSSNNVDTWNTSSGNILDSINGVAYHSKQKLWVATGQTTSGTSKTFVWSKDGKNWSNEGVTGDFTSFGESITSRFS